VVPEPGENFDADAAKTTHIMRGERPASPRTTTQARGIREDEVEKDAK
jgi:hypothetical protein